MVIWTVCSGAYAQTVLVNFYRPGKIGISNGKPALAETNATWELEPVNGYFRIKNTVTGGYLHCETKTLTVGPIQPAWWSAMWTFKSVGKNISLIINRFTGEYLHVERGPLELSKIGSEGWNSAYWHRASNIPTGQLSADAKHVYMSIAPITQDLPVRGDDAGGQIANLQLVVKPSMHVANTGKQILLLDIGDSKVLERRGSIKDNTTKARGWFYESAKISLINSKNVQLMEVPNVSNNIEGQMTSTFANTSGVDLSVGPSGPTGGVNNSNTKSASYSRTVKGYTLDPPTAEEVVASFNIRMSGSLDDGAGGLVPYNNPYELSNISKYGPTDSFAGLFTGEAYKGYQLNGLTDSALGKGLYLPAQVMYEAPANAKGMAEFLIKVSVTLRRVYCTGTTKANANVKFETRGVTFEVPIWINLDMNSYKPM